MAKVNLINEVAGVVSTVGDWMSTSQVKKALSAKGVRSNGTTIRRKLDDLVAAGSLVKRQEGKTKAMLFTVAPKEVAKTNVGKETQPKDGIGSEPTILILQVLLAVCSGGIMARTYAGGAYGFLRHHGLIEGDAKVSITDRGMVWLDMILATPFPEQRWVDPRCGE